MKSVVIITPTIGSDHLKQCVESVQNQTYSNIKHLVVIDGIENNQKYSINNECTIRGTLLEMVRPNIAVQVLEENVGANGWYGHRIYAAFSYLVNEDYIIYLDEDNWLEPNHVESLINTIESGNLHWAYSLRNIVSKEGNWICEDNCESLGWWTSVAGYNHIDTSCYCIDRNIATKAAYAWYGQWGADRQFFQQLYKINDNFSTNKEHTVNYRLDGNPGSPTKEFFIQGNRKMEENIVSAGLTRLPWIKDNGQN